MRKTVLFLMAFLPMFLFAENVTLDEARKIAENFFQRQSSRGGSSALRMVYDGETSTSRSSGTAPTLYVFDRVSLPGFVVVSGDDAAYSVLGYSYDNDFPEGNMPPNLESWLYTMKEQIKDLRRLGAEPMSVSSRGGSEGEVVVQLETAKWDQGDPDASKDTPYNRKTPMLDGKRTYTGCAITATAIAMRYLKWPEARMKEIPAYQTETNKQNLAAREGVTYDWNKMLLKYEKGKYSDDEAEEVSQLMADVGAMLKADYRSNETAANPGHIIQKLVEFMDYDKTACMRFRSQYSKNDWYDLLKNELEDNRPIIYSGYKNGSDGKAESGHSFILDGYTSADYFGVNWGWSGSYNGYFKLDAMEPTGSGAGGNNSHYNDQQNAIIGLKKNEGGTGNYWIRLGTKGFTSKPENVKVNVPFSVTMDGVFNYGNADFSGSFLWALTDGEGVIKEELKTFSYNNLEPGVGFDEWLNNNLLNSITITKSIEVGDRIRVFSKATGETEWTVVKGGDECTWELLVGDQYTIDQTTSLEYDRISRKLKVTTKEGVTVVLASSDGKPLTDRVTQSGNTCTIDTDGLTKGTYLLKLSKGNENRELKLQLGQSQKQ